MYDTVSSLCLILCRFVTIWCADHLVLWQTDRQTDKNLYFSQIKIHLIYEEIYKISTDKKHCPVIESWDKIDSHITCEKKTEGWREESQGKAVILFIWNAYRNTKINNPCEAAIPQEIQVEPGNTGMRGGTNLQTAHPAHKALRLRFQGIADLQHSTIGINIVYL